MKEERKAIWGWAMYDWANSAFVTTVVAGFFPVFFKSYWSAGADVNTSTAQLGLANSIASLLVAILAPILGAIADKGSALKKFMIFFAYLGVLMTAGLFFISKGEWLWAIFVYVMGIIGFSGANIFYDALLPQVCEKDEVDYVSGLGYSLGYLGGGLLLLVNVIMVMKPGIFGLADESEGVRYSFLTVAFWWGIFTIFAILWIKERPAEKGEETRGAVVLGFAQLIDTFKKIKHLKMVMLFLLAYWLYIDGVDTIIRMAVDYGLSLGFKSSDLILALLMVQFVGFPAALAFGKLGQKWDVRKAIFIGIGAYTLITFFGVFMKNKTEFFVLAFAIGLVQGGIQALSRSYYSRLIPEDQTGEFYGFYNMLGKFAAIFGPAMIGLVGLLVKHALLPAAPTPEEELAISHLASRWGIASLLLLFFSGGILFYFVDEEKARKDIEVYSE